MKKNTLFPISRILTFFKKIILRVYANIYYRLHVYSIHSCTAHAYYLVYISVLNYSIIKQKNSVFVDEIN